MLLTCVLAQSGLKIAVESTHSHLQHTCPVFDSKSKRGVAVVLLLGLGVCIDETGAVEVVSFEYEVWIGSVIGVEWLCAVGGEGDAGLWCCLCKQSK